MKKTIIVLAALALAACSPHTTPAIAVASLGIAGAGLASYCATVDGGCPEAALAYSALITNEAIADAAVLESGQTTTAQIGQILLNLNLDIAQGRALVGLTSQQQNKVAAIVVAASSVITLVQALVPATIASDPAPVSIPALTPADSAKLSQMRAATAKQ